MKKLLLIILFGSYLFAGCNDDFIGAFSVNEVYKKSSKSIIGGSDPFVEIAKVDSGASFDDNWTVRIRSNDTTKDYDLKACDGDDYATVTLDDDDELDFENGMSISLVDADGNYIDYLVLQKNDVEGNLDECDYDYETELSFINHEDEDRDIYRDPDKTGDWVYEETSGSYIGSSGDSSCTENSTAETIYVNDDGDASDDDDTDCDNPNFNDIPSAIDKVRDSDDDGPFKVVVCEGSYDLDTYSIDFNATNFDGFVFQGEDRKFVELNSSADVFMNVNSADIQTIYVTGFNLNHQVSCDSSCDESKVIMAFTKNKDDADSKITLGNMQSIKAGSGCSSLKYNSAFGGAFKFSGVNNMQSDCTPFDIEECDDDVDSFSFRALSFKLTSDASDQYGLYFSNDVSENCEVSIHNIKLDMGKSSGIRFNKLNDFDFAGFKFNNTGDDDSSFAFYAKELKGTSYTFKNFDINASGQAFEFDTVNSDGNFTLDGNPDNHSIMISRNTHGLKIDELTNVTVANTDIYPDSDYAIYLTVSGDFNLTNSIIKSENGVLLEDDADVQKVTVNNASITTTDDGSTGALHFKGKIENGLNISNTYINSDYTGVYLYSEITGDLNITDTNITATSDDEARGLYTKEAVNDNINLVRVSIESNKDIYRAEEKVDGDIVLDEVNITSNAYYGLCFKSTLKNLTIKNSDINTTNEKSIVIYDTVDGDLILDNTTILSKKESIYDDGNISGDLIINNSDLNSTDSLSVSAKKAIDGDFNISSSSIYGSTYGMYIYDTNIVTNIKDSNITSDSNYAFKTKSNDKLAISGSCIMASDYEYSLWITTSDTDIDNNCFKSTNVDKLVYDEDSGATFTNNSWYDWDDGDYSNSHKVEDSDTKSCSIGCYPDADDTNFTVCDSFRNDDGNLDDLNISTKIINTSFDLNISAIDSDNEITDWDGTVCYQIKDDNNETAWESDEINNSKIVTYEGSDVIFISKDAWIFIKWNENKTKDDTNCSEDLDGNTSSVDHFSIRPKEFFINISDSTVKAGSDFNLTFLSGYDADTPSKDYNETNEGNDASFSVSVKEQNSNAIEGTFDPDITSDVNFTDGTKDFINITYDEVGKVDINISENNKSCSQKYAGIDCDDKNITDYWNTDTDIAIVEKVETLTITPHHFAVTVESKNFENGLFTYVAESNLTLMSANVDINITAQNENNETTKNYNKDCYANDIKVDYNYTTVDENLSNFLYYYELSDSNSSDGNVTINNGVSSDINRTSFSTDNNGSAIFKLKYNFDRNRSNPINPFDINITNFDVSDANYSDVNGTTEDSSHANFCWGRTKTKDIQTQKTDVNHTIEIEVYDDADTAYTKDFTENSINWFQHENHSKVIEGNVSAIDATTSSTLSNVVFSVDDIKAPNNGDINITISNDIVDTYYMHEKINPWLWYTIDGYGDDYNDSDGSSCSEHPCFKYTLDSSDDDSNNINISSGDYLGGKAETNSSGDTTRIGIKVYR